MQPQDMSDLALNELLAAAFDQGWIARANRDRFSYGRREAPKAPPPPASLNPYRKESR